MDKKNVFSYLFYMQTFFVAGSLLFLTGFFPASTNLIGKTRQQPYDVKATQLDEYMLQPPPSKYDQIILMIIDAWRTDYPNDTNMPFTYKKYCNHLNIKVDIPTVTMPRLKSITTGTISNFIDIVLNLGHTPKLDDSILHSLEEKGKRSIFAGDHTWIRLFPKKFFRANPNMDSFFVNDFDEGDKNVTKFLKNELKLSDWHLMVLHYLGLDHIGHVKGSHSEQIFQKLLEMDNVVRYISRNMNLKKRMLLVTGDHGMRNGGSHGGSDKEELYVPLVAFQQNCAKQKRSYAEYKQIDLTATLAVLLDVKIPNSSIGCLIPELLETFSKEEELYFYHYNALHLMEIWKVRFNSEDTQYLEYFSWYSDAKFNHKHFISSNGTSLLSYERAKQNYIRLSKKISLQLSDSLVRYDIPLIAVALALTTFSALKLIMNVLFDHVPTDLQANRFSWKTFVISFILANCFNFIGYFFDNSYTKSIVNYLLTLPIAFSICFAVDVLKLVLVLIMPPLRYKRKVNFKLTIPLILVLLFLSHTLSLGSSSFIEEEHQTWYYFTPSLLVFLILQNFYNDVKTVWQKDKSIEILLNQLWQMRFVLVVLLAIIACRRLNQTGDKWRHLIDIGDVLSKPENYNYLILIFMSGLLLLLLLLREFNTLLETLVCFVALVSIFLYRQLKQHSSVLLITFWTSVAITAFIHYRNTFYKRKKYGYETKGNLVELLKTNLTCSLLTSALLHKPHNVILLPALVYTLQKSFHLCDNLHLKDKKNYNRCYILVLKTMTTIFIGKMFYFFQGNSNSLASIDLNPGYIGLSSYNPFIVGYLITLNTYCGPINAFIYLMWHMFATPKNALPVRQEKEQLSNAQLLESSEEDFYLVYSLFTVATVMPVAVYWYFLLGFRYHLFIYSVFAPKAFYECFHLLVFYINFTITNICFRLFSK